MLPLFKTIKAIAMETIGTPNIKKNNKHNSCLKRGSWIDASQPTPFSFACKGKTHKKQLSAIKQ